jgi:hypothetical protein
LKEKKRKEKKRKEKKRKEKKRKEAPTTDIVLHQLQQGHNRERIHYLPAALPWALFNAYSSRIFPSFGKDW